MPDPVLSVPAGSATRVSPVARAGWHGAGPVRPVRVAGPRPAGPAMRARALAAETADVEAVLGGGARGEDARRSGLTARGHEMVAGGRRALRIFGSQMFEPIRFLEGNTRQYRGGDGPDSDTRAVRYPANGAAADSEGTVCPATPLQVRADEASD